MIANIMPELKLPTEERKDILTPTITPASMPVMGAVGMPMSEMAESTIMMMMVACIILVIKIPAVGLMFVFWNNFLSKCLIVFVTK